MDRAVTRVHDAGDDFGQRARRVDGALAARPDDGARDGSGVAFLAQGGDDEGEIAFAGVRDDVGGARTVATHAHVERPVEPERKAARRLIELHRRNAEIEHDAVGRSVADDRVKIREAIFDQFEPASAPPGRAWRLARSRSVAVDADHAGARCRQDGAGIAAGAECRVDIKTAIA